MSGIRLAIGALLLFCACIFVRIALLQPFVVPTPSMAPLLLPGDQVIVDKSAYGMSILNHHIAWPWSRRVARFDVIAFHPPDKPELYYVKRLIGLPGDTVTMRRGVLYINSESHSEPYANPAPADSELMQAMKHGFLSKFGRVQWQDWGPVAVPPGSYFVMGDNRPQSEDSRFWGFVPETSLVGKLGFIYFSSSPYQPLSWRVDRIGPIR